ncbi:hypothetical protein FB451DRAFT_1443454 [Mycena latifolia]|nr:hypothetical protein FB451DRAFT_1443454 [Mycena latifolia]
MKCFWTECLESTQLECLKKHSQLMPLFGCVTPPPVLQRVLHRCSASSSSSQPSVRASKYTVSVLLWTSPPTRTWTLTSTRRLRRLVFALHLSTSAELSLSARAGMKCSRLDALLVTMPTRLRAFFEADRFPTPDYLNRIEPGASTIMPLDNQIPPEEVPAERSPPSLCVACGEFSEFQGRSLGGGFGWSQQAASCILLTLDAPNFTSKFKSGALRLSAWQVQTPKISEPRLRVPKIFLAESPSPAPSIGRAGLLWTPDASPPPPETHPEDAGARRTQGPTGDLTACIHRASSRNLRVLCSFAVLLNLEV